MKTLMMVVSSIASTIRCRSFILLGLLIIACAVFTLPAKADTKSYCNLADAYLKAGLIEAAKNVLKTEASKKQPDQCVVASLNKIAEAKQTKPEFDYVRTLANAGMLEEALTALKDELKKNPDSQIDEDLYYLNGGNIEEWRETKLWLRTDVVPAVEILLAVYLVWLFMHIIWRSSIAKPLLVIDDFDDTGISQKHGKSVTALMEVAYQDFAQGHGDSVTRISGNLEAISLPTAIEQALPGALRNPLIQAVFALFNKILPRRTYSVIGYLQNSKSKGAGLTVRIVTNKEQLASITLWENDYRDMNFESNSANPEKHVDLSGDFDSLAEYAAIWLLFKLKHGFRFRDMLARQWRMGSIKRRLGTKSWRAYALFRAGYRAEQARTTTEAKELYVSALREDTELSIAKINLAMLARGNELEWNFARSLWKQSMKERESWLHYLSYPHEQSHYTAMYNLASLNYDDNKVIEAHELAQDLIKSIDKRLKVLSYRSLGGWLNVKTDLRDYLKFLRPIVDAMLSGLKIATDKVEDRKKLINGIVEEGAGMGLPRFQYNMACTYSLWASKETENDELLESSLEYLRNSLWLGISEEIVSKARKDRSLEQVRKKRAKEFDKIIKIQKSVSSTPKLYTLEKLCTINRAYAEKLSTESIDSVTDLLLATETLAQRETLAKSLDIGTEQITEWGLSMELASLKGVELDDINLLYAANIRSLSDLKGENSLTLRHSLNDWAKTIKLKPVPGDRVIQLWLNEAKNATQFVKV